MVKIAKRFLPFCAFIELMLSYIKLDRDAACIVLIGGALHSIYPNPKLPLSFAISLGKHL
jgi:hypothetical protein